MPATGGLFVTVPPTWPDGHDRVPRFSALPRLIGGDAVEWRQDYRTPPPVFIGQHALTPESASQAGCHLSYVRHLLLFGFRIPFSGLVNIPADYRPSDALLAFVVVECGAGVADRCHELAQRGGPVYCEAPGPGDFVMADDLGRAKRPIFNARPKWRRGEGVWPTSNELLMPFVGEYGAVDTPVTREHFSALVRTYLFADVSRADLLIAVTTAFKGIPTAADRYRDDDRRLRRSATPQRGGGGRRKPRR